MTSQPWIDRAEWIQAQLSISRTAAAMGRESEPLLAIVSRITGAYLELEEDLDHLCRCTCASCPDICCNRATVWFDLPDLLYIYLFSGSLPEQQVYRFKDGSCCNLTPDGCAIERRLRPFICTWYICTAQKEFCGPDRNIIYLVENLQKLRRQLEYQFVLSSCHRK